VVVSTLYVTGSMPDFHGAGLTVPVLAAGFVAVGTRGDCQVVRN
jgi:hypothetical protein